MAKDPILRFAVLLCRLLPALLLLTVSVPARATPLEARLIAVSGQYLGVPYAPDPLGEGAGPDPDPLIDRRRVDCVTFVEQALAEAAAPGPKAVLPTLLRLRYRDGNVGFATRNHHFVADWIPHNAWLVTDLTERVGGTHVRRMTKRIDRAALLRARGCPEDAPEAIALPEVRTTAYIPRAAVGRALAHLPPISIAVFVQSRPGIFAAHTGFLLTRGGKLLLRHASQRRGRVIDEPLAQYLKHAPARIVGLKVVGLRPAPRSGASEPPPAASSRRTRKASLPAARRRTAPWP